MTSLVDRTFHWIWGWIGVAVLVAAACVAWSAREASQRLKLEDVQVRGHSRVTAQEVVSTGGLVAGQSLLSIHPARVARRLEHHPWIRHAEVGRRFPATVVIDVREREPVALMLDDGRPWIVDSEGNAVKPWEAVDGLDLPLLSGIDAGTGLPGDGDWERQQVAEGVALIGELSGLADAPFFDELHRGPEGRWSIVTEAGREIVLGDREHAAEAWERYRRLTPTLVRAGSSRVLRVDVSEAKDAYVLFARAG